MSFIDTDADTVPVSRKEFDELRAEMAEIRGERLARAAVDEQQLMQSIESAQSPEEITALIAQANRTYAEARFGADAIEGVDV